MTYTEFKKKHENIFNNFEYIFFAFSNEQFAKGIKKLNIKDQNKLYSVGAGGFVPKEHISKFIEIIENRKNELCELMQDYNFAYGAFFYELNNHEYNYTYEIEDTIDALDLTVEEINNNKILYLALYNASEAIKRG